MRLKWIDTAKGIAMLCVVFGHMGSSAFPGVDPGFVFAFHLPVFFLLSGYTMKRKELDVSYVNNKFSRLMVPYFYTCLCVMVMDVLNGIVLRGDARISAVTEVIGRDLVRSFFGSGAITKFGDIELGTRIGAIWFLPALFFSILIVQWLLNCVPDIRKRWLYAVLIAMLGYVSAQFIWLPFSVQAGMTASVFLLLGHDLRERQVLDRLAPRHMLLLLALLLWGIYEKYHRVFFVSDQYRDLLISFAVAAAGSLLVMRLARRVENSRCLGFIGRNSLVFLCVHLFEMETLQSYFSGVIRFLSVPAALQGTVLFVMKILFITAVTWVIVNVRTHAGGWSCPAPAQEKSGGRDARIDILRGILIVSMLAGRVITGGSLRTVIYSCHMAGFVFLSGYFFRQDSHIKKELPRLVRSLLLPYAVFCVLHLLLRLGAGKPVSRIPYYLKAYAAGMSFHKKLFAGIPSMGPVWFILFLFGVRLLYLLIHSTWKKESTKAFAVLALSVAGMYLGVRGYWLPWSFDCALYALVFYFLGICFRKYGLFECFSGNSAMYFVLSPIWACMIYRGGMEIAMRKYRPYGLAVMGAVCGIVLLYMLSGYIRERLPAAVSGLLRVLGENTLYILIVHTLLSSYISAALERWFHPDFAYHIVLSVTAQLALGSAAGILLKKVRRART